jgi:hypothetical protein
MSDLATRRYQLLIKQLMEGRPKRGAQAHAAERLGVSRGDITKYVTGKKRRGVTEALVERAVERLGIDRAFFFAELDREPHYTEFTRAGQPYAPLTVGQQRIVETMGHKDSWRGIADELSAIHRAAVLSDWDKGPVPDEERVYAVAQRVLGMPPFTTAQAMLAGLDPASPDFWGTVGGLYGHVSAIAEGAELVRQQREARIAERESRRRAAAAESPGNGDGARSPDGARKPQSTRGVVEK